MIVKWGTGNYVLSCYESEQTPQSEVVLILQL